MSGSDHARSPSAALANRSREATFLCYHSVAAEGPRYLTVTPELFERQLRHVRDADLRFGGVDSLAAVAEGRRIQPSVFLTFDDGFADNHSTVLPLLQEHRARAFVFVLPPLLDEGGPLDWPELRAEHAAHPTTMRSVDWSQLEAMAEGGFEVGAHTMSHPHLVSLSPEEVREELLDSRARVRDRLGRCDVLAYPFGEHSAEVEEAAAECGYRFAFTLPTATGQRSATPLSIPRINIDYRDSGARFRAKLSPIGKRVFLSPAIRSLRRRRGPYRYR